MASSESNKSKDNSKTSNRSQINENVDKSGKKEDVEDYDKLDWIALRREINEGLLPPEDMRDKMIRKSRDNPFVPIGCLVTAGVLSYGLWCMKTGDVRRSQKMMRMRVAAQGLTVVALLVGVFAGAVKK